MIETLRVEYGRRTILDFFTSTDNATAVDTTSLVQKDYWNEEWQARHEEALADLQEGRFTVYETGRDFLAAIDEAISRNEARNQ